MNIITEILITTYFQYVDEVELLNHNLYDVKPWQQRVDVIKDYNRLRNGLVHWMLLFDKYNPQLKQFSTPAGFGALEAMLDQVIDYKMELDLLTQWDDGGDGNHYE